MLKIGYSRIDITPTESVPLGGYGNTSHRMSNNILSHLFSTCLAVTDENGDTVLLFHNDLIITIDNVFIPIREAVAKASGVPFGNIIVHSTHSHSVPDLRNTAEPSILRYIDILRQKMIDCASAALSDRKEVTSASIAFAHTKGLNFVRHYVLEDGSYKGDNFGMLNKSPYAGHTTEPDTEMRLLKIKRIGDDDIILANWQSHPHRTGGAKKYDVSADIIGAMRDEMESVLGCKFIYFNGACGNLNPYSRIEEENITADYIEQGKALAGYAIGAENSYTDIALDEIKISYKTVWSELNRPSPETLKGAYEVANLWTSTNDREACIKLANSYGLNSQYAAIYYVRRAEAKDDGYDVPFTAISFGDVAFLAVPYEMFDTNAKYVRENSPYKMTIVSSCTNGHYSYVPSAYGYIHGCYEADTAMLKPGSGEKFAYTMMHMLKDMKNS